MRDEEYQELCGRLIKEHRELQQLGYPVPPEGSGASKREDIVVMRRLHRQGAMLITQH